MATISTTMTGVGSTAVLSVPAEGETVSVALSGTYDMTMRLERATSPAELAWETIKEWTTANATVAFDHRTVRKNERYRLTMVVDTSGTVVTVLSDADKIHKTVTDGEGNPVYTIKQSGIVVNKLVQCDVNVGTLPSVTGLTAVHYSSDGIHFTSIFTFAAVAILTGDNASLATGVLFYTMPTGNISIHAVGMSMGITTLETPTTDDPVMGIGTVIGSTAIATLTTATMQDLMSEIASVNMVGTAVVFMDQKPMDMLAANAHTIHFNIADAYANLTGTDATLTGSVTISWSKLPLS